MFVFSCFGCFVPLFYCLLFVVGVAVDVVGGGGTVGGSGGNDVVVGGGGRWLLWSGC